ncbi:MAG: pyridoxamine 5'-phosphate oxidase family protein [Leptolyngbya sp. SIO3F4]|nr:pyridoxamine 5'-phosphate oxidase family protein [Leptolyngbya sp. SIO3F4]
MAKFTETLSEENIKFIQEQKMFFTGTAPTSGRVNISPKGMDTFRVIDEKTVAYLDLTGSGNETAGHINDNGRLTFMFCSYTQKPLILRLYGRGEVVLPIHSKWEKLASLFPQLPGARQLIIMHIDSIQSSCGFAVPFYEFQSERNVLADWAEKKGKSELENYRLKNNLTTIDGKETGYST